MVERIVRQLAQANENLTENVLKRNFDSKQAQRTNMYAGSLSSVMQNEQSNDRRTINSS